MVNQPDDALFRPYAVSTKNKPLIERWMLLATNKLSYILLTFYLRKQNNNKIHIVNKSTDANDVTFLN